MRLWVNKARTVLVSEFDDGNVTVALRENPAQTWGPPILCAPEGDPIAPFRMPREDEGHHRESRA
jgi:hypothetical protein